MNWIFIREKITWNKLFAVLCVVILLLAGYLYLAKQRALKTTDERVNLSPEYPIEIQKSINEIRQKLQENPGDHDLWRALGIKYYTVGDLARARDAVTQATITAPEDYLAFSVLGDIYRDMNDLVVAEESYKKAIVRDATYVNSYVKLADFYKSDKVNQQDKIEEVYLTGIEKTNDSFLMKQYAGWLEQEQRYAEAIEYWKEALKQEPDNATAINEEITRLQGL